MHDADFVFSLRIQSGDSNRHPPKNAETLKRVKALSCFLDFMMIIYLSFGYNITENGSAGKLSFMRPPDSV